MALQSWKRTCLGMEQLHGKDAFKDKLFTLVRSTVGKSTSVEVVIRKRFMHTQTNNKNAMALAYHVLAKQVWLLLKGHASCHGMQQK